MLSPREIYRRRGLLQEHSSFLSLVPDHGEHVSHFWGTLRHLFRGQFSSHFKNSGLRQTVTRHQEYLEEGSRVTRLCQDAMVSKCLVRESAVNKTATDGNPSRLLSAVSSKPKHPYRPSREHCVAPPFLIFKLETWRHTFHLLKADWASKGLTQRLTWTSSRAHHNYCLICHKKLWPMKWQKGNTAYSC